MKEHLFDKRVVKRALQEGLVSKEDYQRMLDALPDLSHSLQSNTNDIDVNTGADLHGDDAEDDDASSADAQNEPAEPEQLASTQAVHAQQETHAGSGADADADEDDGAPAEQRDNAWAPEL